MPLLAQPPTNPTAAGASRPLNTTHTVTASHYLLVSHRPPTLCSQLSPPASPAACCVARSARPAVCSGALLRSAWPSPAPSAVLVGVGRRLSTRPAARQHRPRGQSGDAVAAKAAMGTGRRVVQLRLLGRQLSRAVHVRPSLVSWCDASFVRAYTLLPSWNGHAKRRGDGPRQARPERQRNAH